MSSNRQRFLTVLSKWPVTFPKKEYDFGYRLRELLKNKKETEEIFPGNAEENAKKIDSLMRLVNNKARNEFPDNSNSGACRFDRKEMRNLIEQHFKLSEKGS